MSTPEKPRIIALFDVDGTLTIPRGEVTPEMMNFMKELSKKITVGIVGGKPTGNEMINIVFFCSKKSPYLLIYLFPSFFHTNYF